MCVNSYSHNLSRPVMEILDQQKFWSGNQNSRKIWSTGAGGRDVPLFRMSPSSGYPPLQDIPLFRMFPSSGFLPLQDVPLFRMSPQISCTRTQSVPRHSAQVQTVPPHSSCWAERTWKKQVSLKCQAIWKTRSISMAQ